MNIKVHREVGKLFRRLEKSDISLLQSLEENIAMIQSDPYIGELLETPFRSMSVRKHKITNEGVSYRIIYVYQGGTLYLLHIGARENLYRDLDPIVIKAFLKS